MVLDAHVKTASCSAYGKLKNLILEKRSDLKSDINKYGLDKLKGSGYVIHHFGESSHFIEVGRSYADYKKMIEILVKAYNNETCETREHLYRVDTIEEYITRVKPNIFRVWGICGVHFELLGEYIKVKF